MNFHSRKVKQHNGFTLIEVMLVIVIVGLMASAIQFGFSGNKDEQTLEQSSRRFAGIFDIAAEYGMLNNLELGLMVNKDSYQFIGYDYETKRWTDVSENILFDKHELPEGVELILQLDDLPIEEPQLFDSQIFTDAQENSENQFDSDETKEQGKETEEEKDKKKLIPQIYMFSGGDITPFSLRFQFVENDYTQAELHYKVTGLYTTPLSIEGPFFDEK
jgi:general secretion pathway protein H